MGSIQAVLEGEQDLFKAEVWVAEKNRLQETIDGLRRRIEGDSAMIQGKYFLQALAITAPTPDAAPLRRRDVVEELAPKSRQPSAALARVIEDMQSHAESSAHKDAYQAQIDMTKDVHQRLRTVQRQLLVALMDLRALSPATPSAGSSSQAETPAKAAAHEHRPSRHCRKSRPGQR